MKKIQSFKCEQSKDIYERLMRNNDKTIKCKCGANANRLLSAPKYFGNTVGRSPAAK